ncbi:c-type cytochrome [Thalassovita aquimarina]|uniref:Cytochrome c n=1 Tax=Thalassovita aquimarina TaxID=2785917 RepID=A0ABS5HUF1_9RHOB|nr:cytochrome c [Thalassovita aquimarina]MBR9652417.1 cytochrome c [Thalassovita aquimarina]
MKYAAVTLTMTLALAGTALAHGGVSNPTVKARMALMEEIKNATGVIGGMAKGKMAFDPDRAAAATAALQASAAQIADAFEAPANDPKSEALPEIWENWDDFSAKADDLVRAASGMETGSLEGVQAGLGALGATCGGCHKSYRMD